MDSLCWCSSLAVPLALLALLRIMLGVLLLLDAVSGWTVYVVLLSIMALKVTHIYFRRFIMHFISWAVKYVSFGCEPNPYLLRCVKIFLVLLDTFDLVLALLLECLLNLMHLPTRQHMELFLLVKVVYLMKLYLVLALLKKLLQTLLMHLMLVMVINLLRLDLAALLKSTTHIGLTNVLVVILIILAI